MATVVLQAVGTAVGTALGGPVGAVIGRTLGAIGGSIIDQKLFGPGDQVVEGPRLDNVNILSSQEGSPIPKVYGSARLSGEIIWATRLQEVQSTQSSSQGGKGLSGPKTTVNNYAYFANFAVGLCEGEIACVRRIWADGKEIDQRELTFRTYTGSQYQLPDALIEAKQGAGNAPAYRGLAYVVFEGLPLEPYGNRIPQISIEVIKPVGQIEKHVHAVNMIPGATEFGYDTQPVVERVSRVENRYLNANQKIAETDFLASLDELCALCANLKQISLVVAWFGSDLRAGQCVIKPKVEVASRQLLQGEPWYVGPTQRSAAEKVSEYEGRIAYGGTPSDGSVLRAIEEIKSRGLKVSLNPFLMMDVPPDNELPSPYGADFQPAFPWRGRITCDPAIGLANTADQTPLAIAQIAAFVGTSTASDIYVSNARVQTSKPNEWSYRRFVLHYARLAQIAGGVDGFLIGSEMTGLTRVRDDANNFPFVAELIAIAQECASILGSGTAITYGADWSEYFGYHPQDGTGDVFFNLDPMWASSAISSVGIDNYMPISDWRAERSTFDEGRSSTDRNMLSSQIAGGEGFHWYYRNPSDRAEGIRTPITDGFGKPWTFRYKDLINWWSNQHFDRVAGMEVATPSPWVPQSKPIAFTEFGCPGIDNGATQPNVFVDRKSSESAAPYFSNGMRDDGMSLAYLDVQQAHWDQTHPLFSSANNPASNLDGRAMVDFEASQLWAWDARPYPAFPNNELLWSDGENWQTGHWLNGRLGRVSIANLIAELLFAAGVNNFDVTAVDGVIAGYVIGQSGTIRGELEGLLDLYRITVDEQNGVLRFRSAGEMPANLLDETQLVDTRNEPVFSQESARQSELPDEARITYLDPQLDYQNAETVIRRETGNGRSRAAASLPMVIEDEVLRPIAENWLQEKWTGSRSYTFGLPLNRRDIQVGDEFVRSSEPDQRLKITRIEEGTHLKIFAKSFQVLSTKPAFVGRTNANRSLPSYQQRPLVHFMDLPSLTFARETASNFVAVSAKPWPGSMVLYSSPNNDGFVFNQVIEKNASLGELAAPLAPAKFAGRWDWHTKIIVRLFDGLLSSAPDVQVFRGANAAAIRTQTGAWEILQFQQAQLISQNVWQLSGLLRGQAGTLEIAASIVSEQSDFVLLNEAVEALENAQRDSQLPLNWRVGRSGSSLDSDGFEAQSFAPGITGLKPFSPVHVQARWTSSGGLKSNWIRRDRLNGDDWEPIEIPLSEEFERYRVEVSDGSGNTLEREVFQPELELSQSELTDIFGTVQSELTLRISQLSAAIGAGTAATFVLSNP